MHWNAAKRNCSTWNNFVVKVDLKTKRRAPSAGEKVEDAHFVGSLSLFEFEDKKELDSNGKQR